MDERQDAVRRWVSDLLGELQVIQEALDGEKAGERLPRTEEAHALLQKIDQAMATHAGELRRLQGAQDDHDGQPNGDARFSPTAETAAKGQVAAMWRDLYSALNRLAIGYTLLHATSAVLHQQESADLAARLLDEITPHIVEINELAPRIAAEELLDEAGEEDISAVEAAIARSQDAWSQQHVHTGHDHRWEAGSAATKSQPEAVETDATGERVSRPGGTWEGSDQPGMPPDRTNPPVGGGKLEPGGE